MQIIYKRLGLTHTSTRPTRVHGVLLNAQKDNLTVYFNTLENLMS